MKRIDRSGLILDWAVLDGDTARRELTVVDTALLVNTIPVTKLTNMTVLIDARLRRHFVVTCAFALISSGILSLPLASQAMYQTVGLDDRATVALHSGVAVSTFDLANLTGTAAPQLSFETMLTRVNRPREYSVRSWVGDRSTFEKVLLGIAAGIGISFLVVEVIDHVNPCTPNSIRTCDLPKLRMAAQGLIVTVPLSLVAILSAGG
jgi:hypothetical protein